MNGFYIKLHTYCSSCDDFDVEVDEYIHLKKYREITCKHFKRCGAIEKYLRKEIENENNTSDLRNID